MICGEWDMDESAIGVPTIAREVDSIGQQLVVRADHGAEVASRAIFVLCEGVGASNIRVVRRCWCTKPFARCMCALLMFDQG